MIGLDPNIGRIILQVVLWLPLLGGIIVAMVGNGPAAAAGGDAHADPHHEVRPTNLRSWRLATFFAALTFVLAAVLFLPALARLRPVEDEA